MTQLIDRFGRRHNNLRISVTDRCNFRCIYCMPEDVVFMEREEILSFEEITRCARVGATLGITKLRLTGGEPLLRRELPKLVAMLVQLPGIVDVGLTTNGVLLAEQAQALYAAGLRRLNVSLDALDPQKFFEFTRRDALQRVLTGLSVAQQVGFHPIKINAVSVRGMTEDQIVPFGQFARDTGFEVRFIEYMPLDASNAWQRERVLFAHEIVERLATAIMPLRPLPSSDPQAPATEYEFIDGRGRIGFIASVSQPFCMNCNRLRLTADGKLRNCLFSLAETDLRALLRSGADDDALAQAFLQSVADKQEGHEINTARFIQPSRPMYAIGG
ncbi:MAG: cyclic pyranopterin monophosphate synthase [Planctomycetaceae bacterium]|nr:MAG: cyclic pyranopterin monophosphate synthase [Planctomycetaceae bacterium]